MMDSPTITVVVAIIAAAVPVLALLLQVARWRRDDRKEHIQEVKERVEWQTGISRDIEGNSKLILEAKRSLETHEDKCEERWRKNWLDHQDMAKEINLLKGASQ